MDNYSEQPPTLQEHPISGEQSGEINGDWEIGSDPYTMEDLNLFSQPIRPVEIIMNHRYANKTKELYFTVKFKNLTKPQLGVRLAQIWAPENKTPLKLYIETRGSRAAWQMVKAEPQLEELLREV